MSVIARYHIIHIALFVCAISLVGCCTKKVIGLRCANRRFRRVSERRTPARTTLHRRPSLHHELGTSQHDCQDGVRTCRDDFGWLSCRCVASAAWRLCMCLDAIPRTSPPHRAAHPPSRARPHPQWPQRKATCRRPFPSGVRSSLHDFCRWGVCDAFQAIRGRSRRF